MEVFLAWILRIMFSSMDFKDDDVSDMDVEMSTTPKLFEKSKITVQREDPWFQPWSEKDFYNIAGVEALVAFEHQDENTDNLKKIPYIEQMVPSNDRQRQLQRKGLETLTKIRIPSFTMIETGNNEIDEKKRAQLNRRISRITFVEYRLRMEFNAIRICLEKEIIIPYTIEVMRKFIENLPIDKKAKYLRYNPFISNDQLINEEKIDIAILEFYYHKFNQIGLKAGKNMIKLVHAEYPNMFDIFIEANIRRIYNNLKSKQENMRKNNLINSVTYISQGGNAAASTNSKKRRILTIEDHRNNKVTYSESMNGQYPIYLNISHWNKTTTDDVHFATEDMYYRQTKKFKSSTGPINRHKYMKDYYVVKDEEMTKALKSANLIRDVRGDKRYTSVPPRELHQNINSIYFLQNDKDKMDNRSGAFQIRHLM